MQLKISNLLNEMEEFTNLGINGDKTICDLELEKQFGTLTTRHSPCTIKLPKLELLLKTEANCELCEM